MNLKNKKTVIISLLVLLIFIILFSTISIAKSQGTQLMGIVLYSFATKLLYFINTWILMYGSFNLAVNAESAVFGSILIDMILIVLVFILGALSILFMIIGLKKLRKEIEGVKFEIETGESIPIVYKFLLQTYSSIQNLNILNMVENQSIETELRQVGIGYYTTTHYSSSSSGSVQSYTSTHPYTYMIRYNTLIQLEKSDGKTLIKMNLKTGKLHLSSIIASLMFLIMGIIIGLIFSFIPFINNFWVFPVLLFTFLSLLMSIILPRSFLRNYKKIANDQFQLLVKKPIISLQIGTDDGKQALQILPIGKRDLRLKGTTQLCPFCGNIFSKGSQICEYCGRELE